MTLVMTLLSQSFVASSWREAGVTDPDARCRTGVVQATMLRGRSLKDPEPITKRSTD
jgi:hypothetical protein